MTRDLSALVEAERPALLAFVRSRAGRILRFESAEDLVQGIQLRILERADSFSWRGEKRFHSWLFSVARSFLADRHAYWLALRRRPGALLRLTAGSGPGAPGTAAAPEPAADGTGPGTFAERREQLERAYAALAALLPRDRDLVRWSSEDVSIGEMAERLDLSYEAAERARLRALERFRKTYRLAGGV